MKNPHISTRPDNSWRPREFLETAETSANEVRKLIRELACELYGLSGSIDDAESIVLLIEQLSRLGKQSEAAQAIEIAERVENLLDLLGTEIDQLLAS